MGVLVKDRFRHNESDENISPSSPTVVQLLKCSSTFHDQLKFFIQNKMGLHDLDLYSYWLNKALERFQTLNTYIRNVLSYKRKQFLLSATWEQYFVLTSADIQFLLLTYQQAASSWNSLFNLDSRYLLWINTHQKFLEVCKLILLNHIFMMNIKKIFEYNYCFCCIQGINISSHFF